MPASSKVVRPPFRWNHWAVSTGIVLALRMLSVPAPCLRREVSCVAGATSANGVPSMMIVPPRSVLKPRTRLAVLVMPPVMRRVAPARAPKEASLAKVIGPA